MLGYAVRALVLVVAAFNLLIGALFALKPAELGAKFFLSPATPQGIATLRADFTAFFLVGGAFAAIGAIRGQAAPLRVPLALLAVALAGRGLDVALRGAGPDALAPMAIEAGMIASLSLAAFVLRRSKA